MITVYGYDWISVNLGFLRAYPPFDAETGQMQLRGRLNAVSGISLASDQTFPGFKPSMLKSEVAVKQLLQALDWIVDAIQAERAKSGAGYPANPTPEDYHRVLTRIPIPEGQQQLYKALYDAGDAGLTHDELMRVMGRRDTQDLAGVLGALGRRINATPGYGETRKPATNMVIFWEKLPDGQWRLRLVPEMRKALEDLDFPWLREAKE